MEFKEEFKQRKDVFQTVEGVKIYFIPNNQGLYEFCTENKTDDEKKVQHWMNYVKRKAVPLEHIPYVAWDAIKKGLGKGVVCDYYIEREIEKFAQANGIQLNKNMLPSRQPKQRGKIQVIGLAVEKYVERYPASDTSNGGKKVSERYHLFVRDIQNKQKYEITLQTRLGVCGSGWCSASYGRLNIIKLDKCKPFSHTPIKTTFIEGFSIDPYTLGWKQEHTRSNRGNDDGELDVENNIFAVSPVGIDPYYPSGYASINMGKFAALPRVMEKRPVWIIRGPSGTGKSTLAGHLEGLSVFETDSVDKLPKEIDADVIVLGNRSKFTVKDIESRLFGEVNVIEVSFEQSDKQRIKRIDKEFTDGGR